MPSGEPIPACRSASEMKRSSHHAVVGAGPSGVITGPSLTST